MKYPKLTAVGLLFIIAHLIVADYFILPQESFVGYIGIFIAGMLYSYGFTGPIAAALLMILASEHHLLLSALIGGLGSMISDLIIFQFFRYSFMDEVQLLAKESFIGIIRKKLSPCMRRYLLPTIGCVIIASPLPDEIGVFLLASSKSFSVKKFSVFSYILSTCGILIILIIGKLY